MWPFKIKASVPYHRQEAQATRQDPQCKKLLIMGSCFAFLQSGINSDSQSMLQSTSHRRTFIVGQLEPHDPNQVTVLDGQFQAFCAECNTRKPLTKEHWSANSINSLTRRGNTDIQLVVKTELSLKKCKGCNERSIAEAQQKCCCFCSVELTQENSSPTQRDKPVKERRCQSCVTQGVGIILVAPASL